MRYSKIKVFNILLYLVYIFSMGFFSFKGDWGNVGLSAFCLVIVFVLSRLYYRDFPILDTSLYIVGNLFILFSFLLGSNYNLYDKIKYYDDFLHFWSGFISVKIGWNILCNINIDSKLNKILFFIVLFFFAMGIAAICEISEFTLDTVFGMNTQVGGLKDTMQDMIDALAGASIMVLYYLKKYNANKNILLKK